MINCKALTLVHANLSTSVTMSLFEVGFSMVLLGVVRDVEQGDCYVNSLYHLCQRHNVQNVPWWWFFVHVVM